VNRSGDSKHNKSQTVAPTGGAPIRFMTGNLQSMKFVVDM